MDSVAEWNNAANYQNKLNKIENKIRDLYGEEYTKNEAKTGEQKVKDLLSKANRLDKEFNTNLQDKYFDNGEKKPEISSKDDESSQRKYGSSWNDAFIDAANDTMDYARKNGLTREQALDYVVEKDKMPREVMEGMLEDVTFKNERALDMPIVKNALNKVTKAEDKYDSLAKEYKPSRSAEELAKLGERDFDGDLANEISKKVGDFYDDKPIGKHSKAAYDLYDSVDEHCNARENAINIKRNDIAEAAKTQAIEKYPKALRGSYLAQTAGKVAYQKATKTDEYKKLSDEFSRVRAKKQAALSRVVEAALRDMGYPVTDENIKKVWYYVIVD